jgi:hypothetical protein
MRKNKAVVPPIVTVVSTKACAGGWLVCGDVEFATATLSLKDIASSVTIGFHNACNEEQAIRQAAATLKEVAIEFLVVAESSLRDSERAIGTVH